MYSEINGETMTLSCHVLIGCPSSGKSTLAEALTQQFPDYQIVSTDRAYLGMK